MKTVRIALGLVIASLALPVLAAPAPSTYSFVGSGGYAGPSNTVNGFNAADGSNYGNSRTYAGTAAGTSVIITAYGSTGAFVGGGTTGYDRAIQTAYVSQYSNGAAGNNVGNELAVSSRYTQNGGADYTINAQGNQVATSDTNPDNNEFLDASGKVASCARSGNNGTAVCNDNASSPSFQHALDNVGAYESLELNFGTSVKLSSLSIGFPSGASPDSDATVLYYIGTAAGCTANPTGKTYAQLVAAGTGCWGIAGNFTNLYQTGTGTLSSNFSSQYWMIGAYMDIGTNVGSGISVGNDSIKLTSVSINRVPEPGSLALFGIAAGAMALRRRRRAQAV